MRSGYRCVLLVFVSVIALLAPAVSAAAARHYTKSATTAVTVSRSVGVTASASASASASVTVDGFTGTARKTATGTARRWASATVRVHARRAATATRVPTARARAHSRARWAARHRAVRLARTKARRLAHSSAYALAHTRALAAAKRAATSAARAAALAQQQAGPQNCSTAGRIAKAGGGYWACSFDEEFNGSSLDSTKWTPVTTPSSGVRAGTDGCFVGSAANIAVSGGTLNLTARKESAEQTCTSSKGSFSTHYTAGQVASTGAFSQTYGRFAVRAAFPRASVAGLHSALWLWPQNLLSTRLAGEIDFAEQYSVYSDRVIPYLHYSYDAGTVNTRTNTNVVTNNYCMVKNVSAFHEYVVEWTSTTITIKYDGQTCLVDHLSPSGGSPFDQPFFVALSQTFGVGPNAFDPAKTPLPATTRVDWVRVWR